MAAGYAALANDGMYREPTCIMRITDDTGAEVYLAAQEGQEVYRQNAARMMTDVLKGVFINGTGRADWDFQICRAPERRERPTTTGRLAGRLYEILHDQRMGWIRYAQRDGQPDG